MDETEQSSLVHQNEKWASANPDLHHESEEEDNEDISVPEIVPLSDFGHFYTFETGEQPEEGADDDFADIIGQGPDETSTLESLKLVLASLKPYLTRRLQEKRQMVQVLEIYPTGETGYKTAMNLSRLDQLIHEIVSKIDDHPMIIADTTNVVGDQQPHDTTVETSNVEGKADEKVIPMDATSAPPKSTDIREIQYYDLRYLENQFNAHESPMVLVRKHAIIISLSPLRAIVTADRIVLSVPDGADALLYMLHEHMHEIVEDTEGILDDSGFLPPEIRAYKALFLTIIAIHQQEYNSICKKVDKALKKFGAVNKITSEIRETIRVLKNTVEAQEIKVKDYQRLLKDLLRNQDDLALMNLSLLKARPYLYKKPLSLEILRQKGMSLSTCLNTPFYPFHTNTPSNSTSTCLLDVVKTNKNILCIHLLISIDITSLCSCPIGAITEHLESYLLDYDTLETKLDFLRVQIENTNRLVFARLNTFQNDLLIVQGEFAGLKSINSNSIPFTLKMVVLCIVYSNPFQISLSLVQH